MKIKKMTMSPLTAFGLIILYWLLSTIVAIFLTLSLIFFGVCSPTKEAILEFYPLADALSVTASLLTFLYFLGRRYNLHNVLAAHRPSNQQLFKWVAGFLLYLLLYTLAGHLFSHISPWYEAQLLELQSATKKMFMLMSSRPFLLFFNDAIKAPLLEEFIFRGLFFISLRQRFNAPAAIILPAAIWSLLHIQYNLVGVMYIFFLGLIFGWAREKTNSLFTPLALHSFNNILVLAFYYFDTVWAS